MSGTDFSINYPLEAVPEPGGYLEIRPGLFWLRVPLPGTLNHINLWLLDDADSWTLVDTGINAQVTRAAWETLSAGLLKDKPVSRIIVTHYHPDHVGLAGYLGDKFQADLFMTRVTAERTRFLLNSRVEDWEEATQPFCRLHGIQSVDLYMDFITGQRYRQAVSKLPDNITFLNHKQPITIGAYEWHPMVVRGHAEDHMSLFCPALNLLISGDQVLPTITSNVGLHFNNADDDALDEYLTSMTRFVQLPEETLVLPSHGRIFTGLYNRIAAIRHSHDKQLEKTYTLCATPASAWEVTPRLFERPLDELNLMLAFGETLAHLTYLQNRGKLKKQFSEETCYYAQAGD